ncbi:GSCFA domain-containing protein [Flavobacteriaceae bacterium GSB9]|nr:GSCFA domain-containing protein [Flavobacteriaceae bacterium GSB9]
MKLQTQIPLKKQSENLIDYHADILLLGSCFSDNIGKKLDYFKFKNLKNPFGILFHPKAIENLVERALNEDTYSEKDIFFLNEQWHCFDGHSKLSSVSKDELLGNLNSSIELMRQQIKHSTHVVITLGTAWVYRFNKTENIVANCHKVPQKEFSKELLSVEDISNSLKNISASIIKVNPKTTIIFTVSPIRHLKDGFVENSRSKAHLISGIYQFLNKNSSTYLNQLFYFPSYEIMMDELRDYRYYAEDMLHPNQTAINYIWEKFLLVWMSSKALKTMEEVEHIQKGLQHKPFNPKSEAHLLFLQKLESEKQLIKSQFSHIVF